MSNIQTKATVLIETLMKRHAFLKGFADKRAGLKPDSLFADGFDHIYDPLSYERGRMLAACEPKLRTIMTVRGKLSPTALKRYTQHAESGTIL